MLLFYHFIFSQAKASRILVGYPDFIKDEQLLNDEYKAVSIFVLIYASWSIVSLTFTLSFQIQVNRSEYLKTVFSVKNFGFLKLVADYKKPVDRNRYGSLVSLRFFIGQGI
jgi:hypothetical protein